MDLADVKSLAETNIQQFLEEDKNGDNLIDRLMQMNLGVPSRNKVSVESLKSLYIQILQDINEIDNIERRKGSWFSTEYIENVRNLLTKYPDDHQTIIRALKISKSSYYRLMHKLNSQETFKSDVRKLKREEKALSKIEEKFLEILVTPPTYPITINEI